MQCKEVISIGSLFQAWNEFKKGKRGKKDVQAFERRLEDNLFDLYLSFKSQTYRHGGYQEFYVHDPKRRHNDLWDENFIYDSYSCRLDKGTHKGVARLVKFVRRVSKNYTGSCWALKGDIKKFFATVDHKILLGLLSKKIPDKNILRLLQKIIDSIVLPHHFLPRTKTKRRMFRKLREKINFFNFNEFLQSYLGYLSHSNSYRLAQRIKMLKLF